MADRCAIMREGRIEQVGTPRELYDHPGNRFVAEFLGETNLIPAMVVESQADRACRVRLADSGVVWSGRSGCALDPGTEVLCSVRPESWRLGPAPEVNANSLSGTLTLSVYLGEATQHHVRPAHDEQRSLRVLELESPPREPGPVTLWVPPEATVILPAE